MKDEGLLLYHEKFEVWPPMPIGADPDRLDDLYAAAAKRGTPITGDDIKKLFSDVPPGALI